jgi:glycosyltransferase involved in cell wall biosynthesis
MPNSKKTILFITPYPQGKAPSQRFRFEQYFEILSQNNYQFDTAPFYSDEVWAILYKKGLIFKKVFSVLTSFFSRFLLVFKLRKYDFVFIHREVCPLGPPVFEWIIAKICRKKIIYDFDDAIWLTDEKARFSNFIRCFWKVKYICRWSYKISCGNDYLASYAKQFNNQVITNPTTIDLKHHKSIEVPENQVFTIGWTGSHSTLKYLDTVYPVLKKLENKIKLLVICDKDPAYDLKNYQFLAWSEEAEVIGLQQIDIGIMPLPNDEWTKGKCGFKALQYMAMKKSVVLSPVGVNTQIIQNGVNGFWASDEVEWQEKLTQLIENKELREKMGALGFETLKNNFSVESNKRNFLDLFGF